MDFVGESTHAILLLLRLIPTYLPLQPVSVCSDSTSRSKGAPSWGWVGGVRNSRSVEIMLMSRSSPLRERTSFL